MKGINIDLFTEKAAELRRIEVEDITVTEVLEDIVDSMHDLGLDRAIAESLLYKIELLKGKYDRNESQPT